MVLLLKVFEEERLQFKLNVFLPFQHQQLRRQTCNRLFIEFEKKSKISESNLKNYRLQFEVFFALKELQYFLGDRLAYLQATSMSGSGLKIRRNSATKSKP